MPLELEPVPAHAAGGLALEHPHPFDVSVIAVADAADGAEAVHGVHDVGIVFGSRAAILSFHEEGILEREAESGKRSSKINTFFLKFTVTS